MVYLVLSPKPSKSPHCFCPQITQLTQYLNESKIKSLHSPVTHFNAPSRPARIRRSRSSHFVQPMVFHFHLNAALLFRQLITRAHSFPRPAENRGILGFSGFKPRNFTAEFVFCPAEFVFFPRNLTFFIRTTIFSQKMTSK